MSSATSTTVPPGAVVDTTTDTQWTPVRVVATLAEPVVGLDTNPLHLDGPVSMGGYYTHLDTHGHGNLPLMGATCVDFALPLATWTRPASVSHPHPLVMSATPGHVWGWACSAGHYTPLAETVVAVRRRPAVEQMARYTTDNTHHLSTGPLKARDVPHPATLTRHIVWWALADPGRLQAMLRRVVGLGRMVRHGNGRVVAWSVEVDPSARQRWLWRNLPDPDGQVGSIRAPYHHHSRRMPVTTLGDTPPWV